MMFGLEENKTQVLTDTVNQVLGTVFEEEKPAVKECYRVGAAKPGATRPVRICFNSSGSVALLLQNAKKLKQTTTFKTIYLSPDRSPDERTARKELVESLRAKIKEEPEFYHFIKDGKICKTDRKVKAVQPALSASSGGGRGKSNGRCPINQFKSEARLSQNN